MVILLLLLVKKFLLRLVTQQYGKGIVSGSKSLTDATGVCYLGLDITHPVGNAGVASYDGYIELLLQLHLHSLHSCLG
jgi:hypothetical protein